MMNFMQQHQAAYAQNAGWGQQQQQQQQPQAAQGNAIGNANQFTVNGCTHATVGPTVRGSYSVSGENHGRRTYKRDGQVGGLDVMLYFWDTRDGPNFCGWWFGPKVGGDQVWAYHNNKDSQTPPVNGWKVPYDGPVDPTMQLTPGGGGGGGQRPAAVGQQQPQNMMQMQMQMQMQQQQQQQQQKTAMNAQQMQLQQMQQQRTMQQQQQEANRLRLQENKQKMEEANRLRMEQQKKQAEDIKRKREEELAKQQALAKQKQEEMKASAAIRQQLQKLRFPNLDTFETATKEVETVVATELAKCGSMKDQIEKEYKAAKEQADSKVEKMKEQRKKLEEQKAIEEQKRKDQFALSKTRLAELKVLVDKATKGAETFKVKCEAFLAKEDLTAAKIESEGTMAEDLGETALKSAQACQTFMKEKGKELVEPPKKVGDPEKDPNAPTLPDLSKALGLANNTILNHQKKIQTGKVTGLKKAKAKEKLVKLKKTIQKYDKDKDAALNKDELLKYAMGEFKFKIQAGDAELACSALSIGNGKKVISLDLLHRIRASIGIFREKALDASRRADRLEKEKLLEEQRESLKGLIEGATKLVTEAEGELKIMETSSEDFVGTNQLILKAKAATSKESLTMADKATEAVEKCKSSVETAKKNLDELKTDVTELQGFLGAQVGNLKRKMSQFETRITKATATVNKVRDEATKKVQQEILATRKVALEMIRHHQAEEKLGVDALYAQIAGGKKDSVSEKSFVAFFGKCKKAETVDKPSDEDLGRFFGALNEEGTGGLSKEAMYSLIRRYMKVTKETVLTEEIGIKGSKTIRRLDLNEVCEITEGPVTEGDTDINRVKVRMLKDEAKGWCTPVGNQGTVFLQDCTLELKVVKETIMTPTFEIAASKETTKKLKPGEVVEVLEWQKKDEGSGLMRAKVKTKDGKTGYASVMGNTGIVMMELM